MAHTPDTHSHGASGADGKNYPPELAEAISVGYEPHDIGLRGVFIFLVSLVAVTLVVLGAMWVIMMVFVNYDRKGDPIASPVAVEQPTAPQPLQPSWNHNTLDHEDMEAMRVQTQAILNSSGTSPTGRRFIPIDTAMDQVLSKLPVRTGHASVENNEVNGGVSP